MNVGVITEFRGEYYWLSNYYTAAFTWRNHEFKSAEQAFSFAKTYFVADRHDQMRGQQAIQFNAQTPGEAKKMGRALKINVEEWDKRKVQYMREIVHAKFATSDDNLVGKLINTGAMMLVEGNDWNDTFWGRCNGKGFNTLGVILMEERGYWSRGELK